MKLKDCVTVEHNDETSVILKVKPNCELDLIKLGYYSGNETMFRVTKGKENNFTIWSKNGKTCSFHTGNSGYTLMCDELWKIRKQLVECIQVDFNIDCGIWMPM